MLQFHKWFNIFVLFRDRRKLSHVSLSQEASRRLQDVSSIPKWTCVLSGGVCTDSRMHSSGAEWHCYRTDMPGDGHTLPMHSCRCVGGWALWTWYPVPSTLMGPQSHKEQLRFFLTCSFNTSNESQRTWAPNHWPNNSWAELDSPCSLTKPQPQPWSLRVHSHSSENIQYAWFVYMKNE